MAADAMLLVSGLVAAVAASKFGKCPEELQLEAEFSPSEYDRMANEKNLALEAEVSKFEQSYMGANFRAASATLVVIPPAHPLLMLVVLATVIGL